MSRRRRRSGWLYPHFKSACLHSFLNILRIPLTTILHLHNSRFPFLLFVWSAALLYQYAIVRFVVDFSVFITLRDWCGSSFILTSLVPPPAGRYDDIWLKVYQLVLSTFACISPTAGLIQWRLQSHWWSCCRRSSHILSFYNIYIVIYAASLSPLLSLAVRVENLIPVSSFTVFSFNFTISFYFYGCVDWWFSVRFSCVWSTLDAEKLTTGYRIVIQSSLFVHSTLNDVLAFCPDISLFAVSLLWKWWSVWRDVWLRISYTDLSLKKSWRK